MTLTVSNHPHPERPTAKTPAASTPQSQADAAQAAAPSASDVGVSVVITATARSMAKGSVSSTADVDAKKVATMKAAIQDGSFQVNPEAIADKMLSNAHEMLRTTLR